MVFTGLVVFVGVLVGEFVGMGVIGVTVGAGVIQVQACEPMMKCCR